jgi:hypothetical protein
MSRTLSRTFGMTADTAPAHASASSTLILFLISVGAYTTVQSPLQASHHLFSATMSQVEVILLIIKASTCTGRERNHLLSATQDERPCGHNISVSRPDIAHITAAFGEVGQIRQDFSLRGYGWSCWRR